MISSNTGMETWRPSLRWERRGHWNCLPHTSPRSWNFPTLPVRAAPSPRLHLLWCCEGNSIGWTLAFRFHLLPFQRGAHLFHSNISPAENRSNYSHLLASLLWKCLYFRIPGVGISKMSAFLFSSLYLHLQTHAMNVNSVGRTDDLRSLICCFRLGWTSDTQRSRIKTSLTTLKCSILESVAPEEERVSH